MADEPAEPSGFTVNDNSDIYYGSDYWNDHVEVREWMNRKISGDPDVYWGDHARNTSGRTFKRGLMLNCGNGHVERGLINEGLVEEVVGIDYSDDLLAQARLEAEKQGIAARYEQLDTNTAAFPDDEFDLVINHAAAHHIAYIDRVFRELCRRLPEDGWFLSFDYVGPHRNQYDWAAWSAADTLNRELPERFRQDMTYPHLPTMLLHDPTEAIHAELIVATMRRYFTIDTLVPLGGALAYPLLTHNRNMFAVGDDDPQRLEVLHRILRADDDFTRANPEGTLFAYIVARPNKSVLDDAAQLATWTADEDEREAQAERNGGEYYPLTTLQEMTLALERRRVDAVHATARADDLQRKHDALRADNDRLHDRVAELQAQCDSLQSHYDALHASYDKIMSLPPYQQMRWFARTDAGRKLRTNPRVAKLTGRGPPTGADDS